MDKQGKNILKALNVMDTFKHGKQWNKYTVDNTIWEWLMKHSFRGTADFLPFVKVAIPV